MPKKIIKPKKPRVRRLTDSESVAKAIARGKYREDLRHFEKQSDGSLIVEVEDAPTVA
jgi:hypothetical protein